MRLSFCYYNFTTLVFTVLVFTIFKDFCSEKVKKSLVALKKINNNLTKQYYMSIVKNCHNFELYNATLETIKKL